MRSYVIASAELCGGRSTDVPEIYVPSSKSHTYRALIFALLAKGKSVIQNPLLSHDIRLFAKALEEFGAQVEFGDEMNHDDQPVITVEGCGENRLRILSLQTPSTIVDVGNSGLALRFLSTVGCLIQKDNYFCITGDHSICSQRSVQPILSGLSQMGTFAASCRNNGLAPIIIGGSSWSPGTLFNISIKGEDSQFVSAFLILAPFLPIGCSLNISVENPGELPFVDLTLAWLSKLGVSYEKDDSYSNYTVRALSGPVKAFEYKVPGDYSTAGYALAVAAITNTPLILKNLSPEDVQGDKRLIEVLNDMGADILFDENGLVVRETFNESVLKGIEVDVNDIPDALPILAVIACFAEGETRLINAAHVRTKECDRISVMCAELRKIGGKILELEDGLVIAQSVLRGGKVSSHSDHRVAMSLAVAAICSPLGKETIIENVDCVGKTYANFLQDMTKAMSSFGTVFRVTTFGESHGTAVGAVVDNMPPKMTLNVDKIKHQLQRRRPGQSSLVTPRNESDVPIIMSGLEDGYTLGTPVAVMVMNEDRKPGDYKSIQSAPRPSHADYTYRCKYGMNARSGGGRASARETIGRVIGGAIAEQFLQEALNVDIVAYVSSVGEICIDSTFDTEHVTREIVDSHVTRCPDSSVNDKMKELIESVRSEEDSIGGCISCVIRNVPPGLGEPVFDKLEAKLAQAMLSLPASKAFEIGSGFAGTALRGSIHNDCFKPCRLNDKRLLNTKTNNSGGIQGGITNGQTINFKVGFKPAATIAKKQLTATYDGGEYELSVSGRHDPCIVPRAVPIVEAMAAIVLADAVMMQRTRTGCNVCQNFIND